MELEGDRCKVVLKTDKHGKVSISGCGCPCFTKHSYVASLKSSDNMPCTNVPVLCQEDPPMYPAGSKAIAVF